MTENQNLEQFTSALKNLGGELIIREEDIDDPSLVISLRRNIGFTSKQGFNPEVDAFEIVYDPVITVRLNDRALKDKVSGEEDGLLGYLFGAASETLRLWLTLAQDIWLEVPFNPEDTKWERKLTLTKRSGASNITIFGGVRDKLGHYASLTITDQSSIETCYKAVLLGFWLWEEANRYSFGVCLNEGGKFDWNTRVGVESSHNKYQANKAHNNQIKPSAPPMPPVSNDKVVETMVALNSAPFEETQNCRIAGAKINENKKGSQTLNLYMFDKVASGELVANYEEDIWLSVDNQNGTPVDSVVDLIKRIEQDTQTTLGSNIVEFKEPVHVKIVKKLAKSGSTYYRIV